ncbi:hypothetical protein COT40_01340 [Candidatus Peregrinibacteria bacterium CG08_land_8_20_14_0_20_41_10]|nr:MAG: hypothetical protein AUJ78_00350 [Candidatus Peregrinibacteria bacterium CG1_02_41_10]PIS32183.1 MAG: hypothetical protein COT40_01340 [Candidatus Peregrinibacteria bacterium CG08_land_8_20_14_0_20_41_10]
MSPDFPPELKDKLHEKKSLFLRVKVVPNASRTQFKETMADGTLKIAVAAPAEKNKANQMLCHFLAEKLETRLDCVKIASGKSERLKLIHISI